MSKSEGSSDGSDLSFFFSIRYYTYYHTSSSSSLPWLLLTRKKPKSSPEKSSLYDEKNFHVPLHAPYSFVV